MDERNELELSEGEIQALEELPRRLAPDDGLERRTLDHLKSMGLVSDGLEIDRAHRRRSPGPIASRSIRGAVAAVVAVSVFVAGYQAGLRSGPEHTSPSGPVDLAEASAQVQRTGSAYVGALDALSRFVDRDVESTTRAQSREVAFAAFYAAAEQLLELDPDDPMSGRLIQGLEELESADGDPPGPKRVVWF